MNTRNALFLSVGFSIASGAAFVLWQVNRVAPNLVLSLGVAFALVFMLSLGAIYFFTRTPMARIEKIGEALRLLSTGRRDQRLETAEFGELRPLASAYNALASSLSDRDDPNLGPVRVTKKLPYQKSCDENDVGAVRKMKSHEAEIKPRQEKIEPEKVSKSPFNEPKAETPSTRERPKAKEEAKQSDEPFDGDDFTREEQKRSEAPTVVSTPPRENAEGKKPRAKRRRKKRKKNSNDTIIERSGLSEDDIRVLFAQFAGALGDEDAPEFGEFAKALREQHDDIVQTHGCKSVRFEVTVVEGNVSLLPRLIR